MREAVNEALGALRGLGTPEEMWKAVAAGKAPAKRPKANTHIHLPPNFSAFESVEQAVRLAAEQGVGVLGAGNYYDYRVYGDFAALARANRIFPLFGLEIISLDEDLRKRGFKINDPGNPGKMYLCGKGITRFGDMTPQAREILDMIRRNDSARMAKVVERLAAVFAERGLDTGLSEDAVIDMIVRRHGSPRDAAYLQERHVCQAFQERLFEMVPAEKRIETLNRILGAPTKAGPTDHVGIQNDIRSHLLKTSKPAYVEETFVNQSQAFRLILELGGIPCYPTVADGVTPICPFEEPIEKLIANIQAMNVHCAEFIPIRNKPETLWAYVKAMRAAGIVVTAGTEHNTLDLIPIEPRCLGGAAVPEDAQEIFWEGACVVAAHQHLVLYGMIGFVDGNGKPNPGYGSAEERIGAFRALGAAVMEAYFTRGAA